MRQRYCLSFAGEDCVLNLARTVQTYWIIFRWCRVKTAFVTIRLIRPIQARETGMQFSLSVPGADCRFFVFDG